MNNIRLHIPAIPYTITRDEYSHDAFTGKVKRFSPMMRSRGFEVYHYGIETSESGATKDIQLMTKDEWTELRIKTIQWLDPKVTKEDAIAINCDPTFVVSKLSNWDSPLTTEFNRRFCIKLQENYRSKKTDIVCIPLLRTYQAAINTLDYIFVEIGIGYTGSYLNYRVFESYCWLSNTLGTEKSNPQNYWFVVPHYFDTNEFKLSLKPNPLKVGYLGRIDSVKGCSVMVEVAKKFPHVQFILCGNGDPKPYLTVPNIVYKAPIHGKERSDYLGDCVAFMHFVTYNEPFGCGIVEAQLCGTPVISTDWGGMSETIEQFKTGLRGHTLADFCYGIQMALDGKFDRSYIRERAAKLYDMYKLAYNYEYILKSILDIHNGKGGWYSNDTYIDSLVESRLEFTAIEPVKNQEPRTLIPLKIWQTWITKDLPPKMKDCVNNLITLHPDFEHNLFDDNDCYEFIKNNFPKEVLLAYEALIPGAFKADLWRLCVLYIHGGCYMDIKLQFSDNFSLNNFVDKEYYTREKYIDNTVERLGIYNGFMTSKKENTLLLKCIIHIVLNIVKNYSGSSLKSEHNMLSITGPVLIGTLIEKSHKKIDFLFAHYGPVESESIKMLNNGEVICSNYKEYRDEQAMSGKPYYKDMWKVKQIYNTESQNKLKEIYNTNTWSDDFKNLLKIVECNKIDKITKYSGIIYV